MGKWFYAFVAMTVLFAAAAVLAIVFALQPKPEENPTIPEGKETGIYYYEVEDDEIILTLNSGNKFTIAGREYNKSGEYTVSGDTLSLDFAIDEDGTATASLLGDTLKLSLGESVMSFLRKTEYTVSFYTDGGTVPPALTVVNGRRATQPADPKKENAVFVGWYKDAALTVPYDFTSEVIKENTTIYARFTPTELGASEYVADFNLGYEGAPEIPAIKTLGGRLFGVTAPEREGYTFGGWFISMYDDGERLSYAYTDDTVLTSDTTLFAVWVESDTDKLASPLVSVSESGIRWGKVDKATGYRISVTAPDGTVIVDNESLGTTAKSLDFGLLDAGEYVISVTAVATGKTSEPTLRYYANKSLDRAGGFRVIDGVLVWTEVENAEKYLITVDCGDDSHNHTLFDNSTSTIYNFNSCKMQKGGIRFTVTAMAAGYASSTSRTFVYERALEPVDVIIYDEARDAFVWETVKDATSYTVTLTVGGKTYTYTRYTSNVFSVKSYTGEMTLSVIPVTDGYLSGEPKELTATKSAPATPTGLSINGMTVTWSDTGADSYELKVGSKSFVVEATAFNLSDAGIEFSSDATYAITVRAIVGSQSSTESDAVNASFGSLIPTLSYNSNTVFWSAVIGADSYEVRVNGGEIIPVEGATSLRVTLTKAGINLIEVRCADIPLSEFVGIQVTAYEVKYMTRSAKIGDITEYLAIGDYMTLPENLVNSGYTFGGWYNVPGAAENNGKQYTEDRLFSGALTLYANWIPNLYGMTYVVDPEVIGNIENGSTEWVKYMSAFVLPIPTSVDNSTGFFLGWYTGPAGTGIKLTDGEGYSLAPYPLTQDTEIYPFFDSEMDILSYELQGDGTFGVRGGSNVKNGIRIRIPSTYEGKPVTRILDNAFNSCTRLRFIYIPDTVKEIGVGAFENCTALESFEVYKGAEGTYETFYSSSDGALIYHDTASDKTYLEIFPRAKSGEYTVPEEVDNIRPYAFNYAAVEKLIISTGVTYLAESSLFNCTDLNTIEFEYGRSEPVTIHKDAFVGLRGVKTLKLPAAITPFDDATYTLNLLSTLTTLVVEDGGSHYTAVDNFLCDANPAGKTILYAPKTVRGDFTPPIGISGIGADVFKNNSRITSVTIPGYIRTIGANAFYGCSSITSVTVSGPRYSALSIGSAAFSSCPKLETVTLVGEAGAEDVEAITIGASAFASCAKLTSFSVGESVLVPTIGANAFSGNSALQALDFADSAVILEIGQSAFKNCTALTSLTIHKSTIKINGSAFSGCKYLTEVSFAEGGSSTLSFGSSVFSGCERLASVHLPKTLAKFDGTVFDGCWSLEEVTVAEGNANYQSFGGALYTSGLTELLFYPKNLDGDLTKLPWESLAKIGPAVFKGNTKIKSLVIGDELLEIGNEAFSGCSNLTKITLGGAGTTELVIGERAFYNCSRLTEATLPSATSSIGAYAFFGARFSGFTIPSGLTRIEDHTFASSYLTEIEIPAGIIFIGDAAFAGASRLNTVTFNNSSYGLVLGTMSAASGSGVFQGTSLSSLSLPSNISQIGAYAFSAISSLTNITVPEGAKIDGIGKYAFYNTGLTSISLGSGIDEIAESAFEGTKLTEVYIPANVSLIKANAFKISSLERVSFENGGPERELRIETGAFANTKIDSVLLPDHLKELGGYNETYDIHTVEDVFTGNTRLHTVEVDSANNIFYAKDGILYLKNVDDTLRLVFCPRYKTGNVEIPSNVILVETRAFWDTRLQRIVFLDLPKSDPNYSEPILEIGSFVAQSAQSYAVFRPAQGGFESPLEYIYFPAHTASINSYTLDMNWAYYPMERDDKGNIASISGIELEFNTDAKGVAFKTSALRNGGCITKLTLPKITEVGSYSFSNLLYLNALDIPAGSSFKEIGVEAFASCKFSSVFLPKTLEIISDRAFMSCDRLTTIIYEDPANIAIHTIGKGAFKHMRGLESYEIPDSVISLGETAFEGCNNLRTLKISNGITDLSSIASITLRCPSFERFIVDESHPALVSVNGVLMNKDGTVIYSCPPKIGDTFTIPAGVKTIAEGAFASFQGSTVIFPAGLTSIGSEAFFQSNVKSVVLPSSLTSIGDKAFYTAFKLESVTFAEGSALKTIGKEAFYNDEALRVFDMPSGVTSIGEKAFINSGITSITIPQSVKTIAKNAFAGCRELETLVISSGVTKIEANAFKNCEVLTDVIIPDSVTSVGDYAFKECFSLKSALFGTDSKLTSLGKNVFESCTSLQRVTFGDRLSSFGADIFKGCTALTEVRLSNAMTSIPASFFAGCTELAIVNIPSGVRTIGEWAFRDCEKIEAVVIPATATSIGKGAFSGCLSLNSVTFADGCKLTSIADNAFENTPRLTDIVLLPTLTSIGSYAFYNSNINIKNLSFTQNMTSIGSYAFFGCSNIETLSLPYSVKSIGAYAFSGCSSLRSVAISTGLTSIGDFAFENCASVVEVFIPSTATTIGANPFASCKSLTVLSIDANNKSFVFRDGALFDSTGLTLISYLASNTADTYVIPDKVIYIKSGAFAGAPLKTMVYPNKTAISTIPDKAFENCDSLVSIDIPNTVKTIGDRAFFGCSSLNNVFIPSTVTNIGDYAFAECSSLSSFELESRISSVRVGEHLFENCVALTAPVYFRGQSSYSDYMYAGTGITELVIDESIGSLYAEGVFANCKSLVSVTFHASVDAYIGTKMFYGCSALQSVELPACVTEIGEAAFAECEKLTGVVVTGKLHTIGVSAFEGCTLLKTVDLNEDLIPEMMGISERAFYGCSSLTSSELLSYIVVLNEKAFYGCSSLTGVLNTKPKFAEIYDEALYGTSFAEIHFSSRAATFSERALAGLTAATTIYFDTASEEELSHSAAAFKNTEATLVFAQGSLIEGLTASEQAELAAFCNKLGLTDEQMTALGLEWVKLKATGVTEEPGDTLTAEQAEALTAFCNEHKIDAKLTEEIGNAWLSYMKTLYEQRSSLTDEEIARLDSFTEKHKLSEEQRGAIETAWAEYKKSGDIGGSDKLTDEEEKALRKFGDENGLSGDAIQEMIEGWINLKNGK